MLLPIAAFLVVTVLLCVLAFPLIRGRKGGQDQVLSGGALRPLIFGPLTGALAGVIPSTAVTRAKLTKDLRRAGDYHRFALAEFLSFRNALVIGWVILISTLVVVVTEPAYESLTWKLLLAGLLGALLLFALPVLLLQKRAGDRLQRIQFALPDALDMITMCATGGLPLQQALSKVSEQLHTTHPDLSLELRILGRQMEAGSPQRALAQFADRIDIPDIQSLTAMVGQTNAQGTSVAGAFQEFGDTLRRTRRQRAEEHGSKIAVKMLLPLVFCLAPPVYMLLLTPAFIELRGFVLEENRSGGILSPATLDLSEATPARPMATSPLFGDVRENLPQR